MPLAAPNLDNRQFADIVAEAKTLIPRYAPEWTNFNESDPGITLVELFAWMTEILVYRLNQVPDRNYIKFLQLIGIELEPARPARAELTFSLSRDDLSTVIVPLGTQVAAQDSTGQPVVFETDQALIAIGAKLTAVQTFDGFGYTPQTKKNAVLGQWFYPFGPKPQIGNALLLGFSSPTSLPTEQINLAVSLFQDGLTPPLMKCGTAIPPAATLVWEYWGGTQWQGINLDSDSTRAFSQAGHVLFPGPGNAAVAAKVGNVTDNLFWIRARVESASYEMPPQISAVRTNTISATQAITFTDEVLGISNGLPNQTFQVANTPVMVLDAPVQVPNSDGTKVSVTSLRLEIDEGQGFIVWQEVDDFFSSGPNDRVFTLDRNTGVITTGTGEHGRIPVINQTSSDPNVIARSYRAGVTNFDPATGGTDEESVADAKLRATLALQSKDRAVTPDDFKYLATQAPGANVKRAYALALYHPNFPNGPVPGVVTVIVVPNAPDPAPTPNQTTLAAVCAYLDKHRLLTSEVYVVGPVYRKIKIQVQLVIAPNFDLATVKNKVQSNLSTLFDPLEGGPDFDPVNGVDGTGWPFGGTVYYSDVYRVIIQTSGVTRIKDNQLLILLDDQLQTFCRDVLINKAELLYNDPKGHEVGVSYDTGS
ncbi:MAG: putative baseplate assembly protein [Verrucomicrobia bacterium]|nr:MAG: putative baseplate assembly protein [Verrucomicrobiota bacterium]